MYFSIKIRVSIILSENSAENEGIWWNGVATESAYDPNYAPYDFHIFRSMVNFKSGHTFDNIVKLEHGSREFFASKSKEW